MKKIYTLTTDTEIREFCNTTYIDANGENHGILGACASYEKRGTGYIEKIEIYQHDQVTKGYLFDAEVPTSFFALAYNEEDEPCWYYPVQAVSNVHYIPVIEEYGHWSWMLISPYVLEHVLGEYKNVRVVDGDTLQFIRNRSSNSRRNSYRRPRESRPETK